MIRFQTQFTSTARQSRYTYAYINTKVLATIMEKDDGIEVNIWNERRVMWEAEPAESFASAKERIVSALVAHRLEQA